MSAAAAGLSPDGLAAAQAYADAQASFALIVAKGGRIVHEHYAEGFGPDSKFATASMHKAVVALAYGAAIKAGKLSLDDRLDRHLTEFSVRPEGAITLRQLLQMAGGLNPPPGDGKGAPPLFAQLMFAEDIRAAAAKHVQVAHAGTVFSYSNASTQLAGMALEAALGEPYGPWLSRTLGHRSAPATLKSGSTARAAIRISSVACRPARATGCASANCCALKAGSAPRRSSMPTGC